MSQSKLLSIGFVLLVLIAAGAILHPLMQTEQIYRWEKECVKLMYDIHRALLKYSSDNDGKLPPLLSHLYPQYIDDRRVQEQVLFFSEQQAAMIYWYPEKLGNPEAPVVQIIFKPGSEVSYARKDFVLWGDGTVGLRRKK
ncbi:MAG TPA: hypothetical protein PKY88_13040 [Anaerohalosphaeraceae bacterium]|nr:hypothetical protein [Anaerohalosphaeraceae bacterium]